MGWSAHGDLTFAADLLGTLLSFLPDTTFRHRISLRKFLCSWVGTNLLFEIAADETVASAALYTKQRMRPWPVRHSTLSSNLVCERHTVRVGAQTHRQEHANL